MDPFTASALADGDACLLAHRVLSKHPDALLQGLASASPEVKRAFVAQLHKAISAGTFEPRAVLNAAPELAATESVVSCPSRLNADGVRPLLPAVASFIPAPQSLQLPSVCRTWYLRRGAFRPLQYRVPPSVTQRTERLFVPSRATRFSNSPGTRPAAVPRAVARGSWSLSELRELSLTFDGANAWLLAANPAAQDAWTHVTRLERLDFRCPNQLDVKLLQPTAVLMQLLVLNNREHLQRLHVQLPYARLANLQLPRLVEADFSQSSSLALCCVRWPCLASFSCADVDPDGSAAMVDSTTLLEAEEYGKDELPLCVAQCFRDTKWLAKLEVSGDNMVVPILKAINRGRTLATGQQSADPISVGHLIATLPRLPGVYEMMPGLPDGEQTPFVREMLELCTPRHLELKIPSMSVGFLSDKSALVLFRDLPGYLEAAMARNPRLRYSHPGEVVGGGGDGATVHRFKEVTVALQQLPTMHVLQMVGDAQTAMGRGELRFSTHTWSQSPPAQGGVTSLQFRRHFEGADEDESDDDS